MNKFYFLKEKDSKSSELNLDDYEVIECEPIQFKGEIKLIEFCKKASPQINVDVTLHPTGYSFQSTMTTSDFYDLAARGKIEKGVAKGIFEFKENGRTGSVGYIDEIENEFTDNLEI